MRKRPAMKLLLLVFSGIIVYLVYDIWFGRNGVNQYEQMEVQLAAAQKKAEMLQRRNQALQDEIADLQQGNLAVEELARSELGMIKPGETFYRVIDGKSSAQ